MGSYVVAFTAILLGVIGYSIFLEKRQRRLDREIEILQDYQRQSDLPSGAKAA